MVKGLAIMVGVVKGMATTPLLNITGSAPDIIRFFQSYSSTFIPELPGYVISK